MKVADLHCDTIAKIYEKRSEGEEICLKKNSLHLDLEKMRQGDYGLQNFALFIPQEREQQPFEHAMKLLDVFYEEMEENQGLIGVVASYKELEENWKSGKMSAMLTLEGGGACQGSLAYLRDFYRLGVRMMTLVWNYPNELGYPNYMDGRGAATTGRPDMERGLTETGILFLEEMERLGMIIDVSHLNDAGTWDVFRHTKKPFVASHSNARALVPQCPRNLTDEMLRELGQRGGVAGVNYCIDFLHDPKGWPEGEAKKSLVRDMVRHMKHMKQVGGIGCIGLGSDFDGIKGELEIKSGADLPLLEREMRAEGFTQTEVEAVFYKNVLRLYRELL